MSWTLYSASQLLSVCAVARLVEQGARPEAAVELVRRARKEGKQTAGISVDLSEIRRLLGTATKLDKLER